MILPQELAMIGFLMNPVIAGMVRGKLKKEMLTLRSSRILYDLISSMPGASKDVIKTGLYPNPEEKWLYCPNCDLLLKQV